MSLSLEDTILYLCTLGGHALFAKIIIDQFQKDLPSKEPRNDLRCRFTFYCDSVTESTGNPLTRKSFWKYLLNKAVVTENLLLLELRIIWTKIICLIYTLKNLITCDSCESFMLHAWLGVGRYCVLLCSTFQTFTPVVVWWSTF